MKVKVYIADDHQIVIDALTMRLKEHEDQFSLVGTANDGREVLEYLKLHSVDVLILDISMPHIDGITVLKEVREKHPRIKVLVLTMFDDLKHITEMTRNGAKGYILKNKGALQVVDALEEIAKGGEYFPNEIKDVAFKALQEGNELTYKSTKKMIMQSITDSESQLLGLLTLDLTGKEIADRMCLSEKTIESRKRNLRSKLGIKGDKGLVRFAVENGFSIME